MTAPQSKPHADPRTMIVSLEETPGRVLVHWADGHESAFPISWLRHDCYFPAHLKGGTQDGAQRRPISAESVAPERITRSLDGALEITWRPDGETTRHAAAWLRDHCPSNAERARRRRPTRDWPKGAPPEFAYDRVAADDHELLAFTRALLDHGLVILRGVPPVEGQVAEVAALIGPIHETGYGRVVDVKTTSELAIEANTPKRLELHTDESYRYSPPGISLFHCLAAAPGGGGESLLVDGYAVAEALRRQAPEAFDVLCREPLGFTDTGGGAHYFARGRVISLDLDGNVVGIRYSDRALLPPDLPPGRIEPVYPGARRLGRSAL